MSVLEEGILKNLEVLDAFKVRDGLIVGDGMDKLCIPVKHVPLVIWNCINIASSLEIEYKVPDCRNIKIYDLTHLKNTLWRILRKGQGNPFRTGTEEKWETVLRAYISGLESIIINFVEIERVLDRR